MFQQFHLAAGVTVLDNVADGLLYVGRADCRRRTAARARPCAPRRSGRTGWTTWPHELSGGERQRVAIARAVVGEPVLLLADEPTGNLDTASGAAVLGLLARAARRPGTTVVVITHDLQIAARLPRAIEMRDGRTSSRSQCHE